MKDVVVIGGGPAGLAAAIYLGRARLDTVLLAGEKAGGQLMLTTDVENYPGFAEGIKGPELMKEMREQAGRFEVEIINEDVDDIEVEGEEKVVRVGEKEYKAKALVITTGARARMLGVGEEEFLGKGVSTCAVCDAAFFKGKTAYVVGGGDAAMEDALALKKHADRVKIIHRRGKLRASKIMQERVLQKAKIQVIWNSEVEEVKGGNKLEEIKVVNNKSGKGEWIEADGLFLAIGHIPETDFIGEKLERDNHGYLVTRMVKDGVDQKEEWLDGYPTQTSAEGVFGAGDVVDFRYRQAVTAAGQGVMAALDVEKFLTGKISGW